MKQVVPLRGNIEVKSIFKEVVQSTVANFLLQFSSSKFGWIPL